MPKGGHQIPVKEKITSNNYDNSVPETLPTYSYTPSSIHSFFVKQKELGKPVKVGKKYTNAFFDDLASIDYMHTYVTGMLLPRICGGGGIGHEFDTQEKKQYKANSDEYGLYRMIEGKKHYIPNGDYRYVVSPKGGLYIFPLRLENVYHNGVRASQPVQCAGGMTIKNGQITLIDNGSGHYRPTQKQFFRTLGGLYAANLIDEDTKIESFEIGYFGIPRFSPMGNMGRLIHGKIIKVPNGWEATDELHAKMKNH